LQRQPEDDRDRDRARGRQQTLNRQVQDVVDDGKDSSEIDDARKNVLDQLDFVRTTLANDEGADERNP
jgi:hypothetical protein